MSQKALVLREAKEVMYIDNRSAAGFIYIFPEVWHVVVMTG
jgi:hypothetical protein